MIKLEDMLEHGEGVAKDVLAAMKLYKHAAESGNTDAMYFLAHLLKRGDDGVAKDVPAAAAFFREAAERGHADVFRL